MKTILITSFVLIFSSIIFGQIEDTRSVDNAKARWQVTKSGPDAEAYKAALNGAIASNPGVDQLKQLELQLFLVSATTDQFGNENGAVTKLSTLALMSKGKDSFWIFDSGTNMVTVTTLAPNGIVEVKTWPWSWSAPYQVQVQTGTFFDLKAGTSTVYLTHSTTQGKGVPFSWVGRGAVQAAISNFNRHMKK